MKCQQHEREGGTCSNLASYRYTWPGRDEAHVCEGHARQLRAIAAAMGLPLQLIPLSPWLVGGLDGSLEGRVEYPFSPGQLRQLGAALAELDAAGELASLPGDPRELLAVVGAGLQAELRRELAGEPAPVVLVLALDVGEAQALAVVCLLVAERIRLEHEHEGGGAC